MTSLYDKILAIAQNYMGPAAEDYIQRRLRIVQLGGDPKSIQPDKLDRLAAGIGMTAKVYMSRARAEAFQNEILALKDKTG
jgi:hypothetical protein